MNWVLWREYRLNRWILVLGVVALVLPYIAALIIFGDMSEMDGAPPSVSEIFGGGILASFVATQVVLAILGGNAIAGERADRSAEFMGYLPVPRTLRLRAKLTLASLLLTVSWGVSALAIGIVALLDPEIVQHPEFSGVVVGGICIAATSLATYALCWLISSMTTNPAIAVMGGLVTVGIGLILLSVSATESNVTSLLIGYTIFCLTLAGVCFWTGTRHYLKRVEP